MPVPPLPAKPGRARNKRKRTVFKEFTGLWGWVLKEKAPAQQFRRLDPRAKGLPLGHIK